MTSVKLQPKLKPAPVTLPLIKRGIGNDFVFQELGPASFAIYAKDRRDTSQLESVVRAFADKKNFILITGPSGIGKHEMLGRPYFQFSLKERPARKPGPPTLQPQAVPSTPAAVPNGVDQTPKTAYEPTKKPIQRFQNKNRIGWSKEGFQSFYRITKPGGPWTNIKQNFANAVEQNSVISDCADMHNLFSGPAPYKPLADMFGQFGALLNKIHFDHEAWQRQYGHSGDNFASKDKSQYLSQTKRLLSRIQPRLERLYDFARRESLAKSIVVKSLKTRLI